MLPAQQLGDGGYQAMLGVDHLLVAAGLIQVPEGRRIFPNLTVLENVRLACQSLGKDNFRLLNHYQHFRRYEERAWDVIRQVGLTERATTLEPQRKDLLRSPDEEAFRAAGLSLFPRTGWDLRTNCSCPDWSNPCKHIAAVYYLLGEEFDRDPFLLFKLRGRTREQVIAALRTRRAAANDLDAGGVKNLPEIAISRIAAVWSRAEPRRGPADPAGPGLSDLGTDSGPLPCGVAKQARDGRA